MKKIIMTLFIVLSLSACSVGVDLGGRRIIKKVGVGTGVRF